MLQSMKRIQVIGPKDELNRVVDFMYQAGTVHLENASEEVPFREIQLTPVKLEAAQNISDVLSKIQAIFSTLPVIAGDPEQQATIQATLEKRATTRSSGGPARSLRNLRQHRGNLQQERASLP